MKKWPFYIVALLLVGLGLGLYFWPEQSEPVIAGKLPGGTTAHLLAPASNNAVAFATVGDALYLFSFSGLGEDKGQEDIKSDAYAVNIAEQFAVEIPPVPGDKHRLASTAVTLSNTIYIIGGYTVAQDGTEVSTPEVYAFNAADNTYTLRAPMPVPVDDTVALVYQDRYIYLVSGWHDVGNVEDVQVYDTVEDVWFEATPYPGSPVFGHSGSIAGNRFVIADGVAVLGLDDNGRRQFGTTDEVYLGQIDAGDPATITWEQLPAHPGNPLYRMAAAAKPGEDVIVFAGGSDNPYNYDGIGYNGVPSQPSASVFAYNIPAREWHLFGDKLFATMDHRGMIALDGRFYIIGGMVENQEVSDAVTWFSLGE